MNIVASAKMSNIHSGFFPDNFGFDLYEVDIWSGEVLHIDHRTSDIFFDSFGNYNLQDSWNKR